MRSISHSIRFAFFIGFAMYAHTVSAQAPPLQDVRLQLERLAQARDANSEKLTSALASGRLTQVIDDAGTEPITTLDSAIQVLYDEPKFRVHLIHDAVLTEVAKPPGVAAEDFEKWIPSNLSEQVVIFDGEKLYSIVVNSDQSCSGTIYFGFAQRAVMRLAGYPFANPVRLWEQALKVEALDIEHTSITPLDEGGILGTLTKNTYRMKFFVLDEFAYDLRRVSSYRIGESQPFRDYVLQWQEADGVHFVSRFVNTVTLASGDTASEAQDMRKLTVEFEEFVPNVEVSPAAFEISSIQLPEGTVFTDKRTSVAGGPKQLIVRDQTLQPVNTKNE